MPITLSDGTDTINLPEDLLWGDEFSWNPVQQSVESTITGAVIVSSAAKLAGRQITLQPEDDDSAWMTRAVLEAVRNFAAEPGKQMVLTLRGQPYDVVFRHQDGSAIDSSPVVHYNDVDPDDYYRVTLRFMEV